MANEPGWNASTSVNTGSGIYFTIPLNGSAGVPNLGGATEFTWTAWLFNSVVTGGATGTMVSLTTAGAAPFAIQIYQNGPSGALGANYDNGAGVTGQVESSAAQFGTSVFRHIAVRYKGDGATNADKLKLFVDGSELATGAFSQNVGSTFGAPGSGHVLHFGIQEGGLIPWSGYWFNTRVWNIALGQNEIAEDAVRPEPSHPGALLFWMENLSDTGHTDLSPWQWTVTKVGTSASGGVPISNSKDTGRLWYPGRGRMLRTDSNYQGMSGLQRRRRHFCPPTAVNGIQAGRI